MASGFQNQARRLSTTGDSLYNILNIKKSATPDEVKRAYRQLALKYHPDKNRNDPSCHEKFQDINRAHKILSDQLKRSIYDQYGSFGWFRAFMICLGISTCCFGCCCCCCFCFNFCCGKFKPKVDPRFEEQFERDWGDGRDTSSQNEDAVSEQPKSTNYTDVNEPEGKDDDLRPIIDQDKQSPSKKSGVTETTNLTNQSTGQNHFYSAS